MKSDAPRAIAAMGFVFGVIGTSPLFAFREAFTGPYGMAGNESNVTGVLSLMFWSLVMVVSFKYVIVMLHADNRGEGGILALTALASGTEKRMPVRRIFILLGLLGVAMFFADGFIAPAISMLAAVEGMGLYAPPLDKLVLPVSIMMLAAVFLSQPRLADIGETVLGWVMCLWFIALAMTGGYSILLEPRILVALSPMHAIDFFLAHPGGAFFALGAVVLVVVGAETLYTELGHFGKSPIRLTWFALVLPALTLNYFGQGAAVLINPATLQHPFYLQGPGWALGPMVVLAILATMAMTHALILRFYSLALEAMNLGFTPRFEVVHPSETTLSRIYVPWVNRALFVGVIALLTGFHRVDALAGAYGVATTWTMVIATFLLYIVARQRWKWVRSRSVMLAGSLFIIDAAFFAANLPKVLKDGWVPIALGGAIFVSMSTWKRGRQLLFDRLGTGAISAERFIASLALDPPQRVSGTAVFLTRNARGIPHALLHNIAHNRVLHERVILLTVRTANAPHVASSDRAKILPLGENFYRINMIFGFKDLPDVPAALAARKELRFDMMETSFFLSRETLIPTVNKRMAFWRERLFVWMARNSAGAQHFYNIPTNRVIELGAQIEL